MALDLTTAIVSDLAGRVLASSLVSMQCALAAWSPCWLGRADQPSLLPLHAERCPEPCMGPLMSSGFGRDGSRPDHGHRFGPGRTRFSVQPCEHAMCAGGTVALLAWSRRPTIPVAATRRTLSGASSTSCSAKAEPRR